MGFTVFLFIQEDPFVSSILTHGPRTLINIPTQLIAKSCSLGARGPVNKNLRQTQLYS